MCIVMNVEPYGYSEKAADVWRQNGYDYVAASWNMVNTGWYPDVCGLIVRLSRRVDMATLERFPDLAFIVSATTGLDHLDLDALGERNIALYSLRGHSSFLRTIPSTAEHTWALLLALVRAVPAADRDVREGRWERDRFRGQELKGKTLGVVGMGRTGGRVARYANAFEMDVIFYDPYVSDALDARRVDTLAGLLEESDIVTLHIHLKPDTDGMIGSEELHHMRHGAFLVNTSRGRIWDEAAVAKAVTAGNLGGVAADVLDTELVDIQMSPLWKAQEAGANVVLTPHIGGATWEAMHACERHVAQEACSCERIKRDGFRSV